MAMPYDAREIANFVLDAAESDGQRLTMMALIKVLFFAHGWHLAKTKTPLIKNGFEAWKHGPVIRIVYDQLKDCGSSFIDVRLYKFDPISQKKNLAYTEIDEETKSLLIDVLRIYGHLHAYRLSDITHEPGSPWDRIWNQADNKVSPGMKIPDELILKYFQQQQGMIAN